MLEDIKKDIEKLIALYEGERREKLILRSELEKSKAENDSYRKQITDLERQVDNLRLTEAFTSSAGNNTGAKDKIERLIREIDKCISLLGKCRLFSKIPRQKYGGYSLIRCSQRRNRERCPSKEVRSRDG